MQPKLAAFKVFCRWMVKDRTLIVGILMVLAACWFWYYLIGNPLDELALIQRGQTVPGFIIDTWEDAQDDDRGRTGFFHAVVYEYRLSEGREYTQRTKDFPGRLKDDLRDLQQPLAVEVEYLPDDPAVSRIKGEGCQDVLEWLWRKVGLGLLLLAGFVSPGIVLIRSGLRDRKPYQGGAGPCRKQDC